MASSILFKILNDAQLPFDYTHTGKGIYKANADQAGIDTSEQLEFIEVIDWDYKENTTKILYHGNPEPIYDEGKLCYIKPSDDGFNLEKGVFGEWKCQRCGHVSCTPMLNGSLKEPFECFSDVCGRKGPFVPMFPKELIKPIWKVSEFPMSASASEIYKDIYEYIKVHLILSKDEYHIMTLWMMASWLVDEFNTAPYLLFIAPKSSGKTQALNIIHELGYRSFLTVSVTASAIFRAADLWKITPLIDESEFQVNTEKPSESSQALYGLLNGGYKRGNCALRIEGDARIPTSFDIFGFKAVASTKLFLSTLESRSIIINMNQGMPKNILIDENRARIIRAKLLYFRFSTLKKIKIVIPKSNSGRLTELFIPLYTTAQTILDIKDPITYEDLIILLDRTVRGMESDRKQEELGTPEARIIGIIVDLMVPGVTSIMPKTIAQETKWADEENPKEFRKTTQRVGYILKELGIKTRREDKGNIIDFTDDETVLKINELKTRYINP